MQEDETIFRWEEVQGKARITGCTRPLRFLYVPEKIAGLTVFQIGDYAFMGMEELCEAELPRSVESLGDHVFFNCIHLKKGKLYNRSFRESRIVIIIRLIMSMQLRFLKKPLSILLRMTIRGYQKRKQSNNSMKERSSSPIVTFLNCISIIKLR